MVMTVPRKRKANNALTLPYLVIDAGNANLKWGFTAPKETIGMIPAWAKKLPSYQSLPSHSIATECSGERWVFGNTAEDLGGFPMFELGKPRMYPIFVKALFEHYDIERVEVLHLLVPSERNIDSLWVQEVEPVIREYVEVGSVNFIPEGIPPYEYATSEGLWRWPNFPNAILDCGGGELSMILFTRTGVIDAEKTLLLPGTSELARRIAIAIAGQTSYQPNAGTILSAIENATFNYIDNGLAIDFYDIFQALKAEWLNEIRATIVEKWQKNGIRFGQIMLVGGGSQYLLSELLGGDKPYILPESQAIQNFPQLLNIYSMLQMAENQGA